MRFTSVRRALALSLGVTLAQLAVAPVAAAQVIRGIAVDSVSRNPLPDLLVTLVDSAANFLGAARTSDRGRFVFIGRGSGFYALDLRAIGFKRLTSPWIPLAATDTVEVTLRVVRLPVVLSPIVVKAQRDSIGERSFLGMKLKTMASKIISPQEIDLVRGGARDYIELVQSVMPAGYTVRNLDVRINTRCIASTRNGRCVMVFVDGARMLDAQQAIDIAPPERVHHVVFVRPSEAGVLFGTQSDAGVLLIFTKAYSAAASR